MKQGAEGDLPSEVISQSVVIEYKYVPKGLTDVRTTSSYVPLNMKNDLRNHLGGRFETTKYTDTYYYSAPKPQSSIVRSISKLLGKIFD